MTWLEHDCPTCEGDGMCYRCAGSGIYVDDGEHEYECVYCHGTGTCPACGGAGTIKGNADGDELPHRHHSYELRRQRRPPEGED
jgi:hypothetical protein